MATSEKSGLLPGGITNRTDLAATADDDAEDAETTPDYSQISSWHLLGEAQQSDDTVANAAETPETHLQLKLMGIFKLSDTAHAIIAADDQKQKTYRPNDTLPGGAILQAVEKNQAIILNDNRRESLPLMKPSTEPPPEVVEDPELLAE